MVVIFCRKTDLLVISITRVSYSGFNLLKNKECEVLGCVVR